MPPLVRVAIIVLWLSWGWAMWGWFEMDPLWPQSKDLAVLLTGIMIFQAAMIYFASQRRGWARFLLALHVVLGLVASMLLRDESASLSEWLRGASAFIVDGVAVCLLFTAVATSWYRARGEVSRAL